MPREHLQRLAVAAKEAFAYARQGALLRHDTGAPIVPLAAGDGDDVVVLLHGLFASAGVLRPLRAKLEETRRLHTATLSYAPGPGVRAIAARLDQLLDALPGGARVHLVGHSLGGIVVRHCAITRDDPRVVQTISMASPFGGVARAAWLGLECGRDLDPSSPVLRDLRLRSASSRVPHLSIIAGSDALATVDHALPDGDVVVLDHRGHNTLLFDDEAARVLSRRIAGLSLPGVARVMNEARAGALTPLQRA